jgi:uncharacterized cupredoxin-like copper-binding protein
MRRIMALTATLGLLVLAGCGSSSSKVSSAGYGTPGVAGNADRTISVHVLTSLRYDPAAVSVRPGETVLFKVFNDTTQIHEFLLGDTKVQDSYQRMMAGMGSTPMLMGDQPNSIDIQPGQTKQLAWTFPTTAGATVIYASHQAGDYAHGLRGLITVGGSASPSAPAGTGSSSTTASTTSTTMHMTTSTTGKPTTTGGSTTTMGNMPAMP